MKQIKKVQVLVEEANKKCVAEMKECEAQRHSHLTQIGNILHPSVPISDNEVYIHVATNTGVHFITPILFSIYSEKNPERNGKHFYTPFVCTGTCTCTCTMCVISF